jgi:hypothetical protein
VVVVFQGETGGAFSFSVSSIIPAVSGYVDVVDKERVSYRFDGMVSAGILSIVKSGVSNLNPGDYVMLPQVVDSSSRIYFLDVTDLQIVEVPDFFSDAVLVNGNSILLRLQALENAQGTTKYYTAGAGGVQTAKLLALQGSTVVHADCTNINHAGCIVGISTGSASAGDQVPVQPSAIYSSSLLSFSSTGAGMVGLNGSIALSVPINAAFVEFVGVVIDSQSIQLFIDSGAIVI